MELHVLVDSQGSPRKYRTSHQASYLNAPLAGSLKVCRGSANPWRPVPDDLSSTQSATLKTLSSRSLACPVLVATGRAGSVEVAIDIGECAVEVGEDLRAEAHHPG